MENKHYIMRENYLLDAIWMARYTQQYIDIVVGIKNDEKHCEVAG